MKIVKRINNNTVICVNQKGRELVAIGRGIGFPDGPADVSLDRIERTFYGVDSRYLALLDELDPSIMEFSAQLADIARSSISRELSANLPFTLADHISFAIKRCREHLYVKMPLAYDVQQSYPTEYRIAQLALKGIERNFDVRLPRDEASGIALCIANSAVAPSSKAKSNEAGKEAHLIDKLTRAVEDELGITVSRDSFDFARYATHVRYLLERISQGQPLETENASLYRPLSEQYPEAAACVECMSGIIRRECGADLTDEEKVYLILHVNRLVDRSADTPD